MTSSPPNLLAVRSLLQPNLRLNAVALGITGDPKHRGGYHCGADRVLTGDYSVIESARDRAGLSDYAAALDVGGFELRLNGRTHNLRTFSTWCVNQCVANSVDSRDIREIIYSADGKTVRRWDRLGRRSTGDSSHLSHTHFSFFRDAVKAGRDQRPLFVRYLTDIGLLAAGDDTMEQNDVLIKPTGDPARTIGWHLADMQTMRNAVVLARTDPQAVVNPPHPTSLLARLSNAADTIPGIATQLTALTAQVAALTGKDLVDEQQIVTGLLAVLTPEAIAALIPEQLAEQVADELARRLASTPPGS